MDLLNSKQTKELDHLSEAMGVSVSKLMARAGQAVADQITKRSAPGDGPIIIFVGKGNNGGDGKVAAKLLEAKKYSVVLIPQDSELKKYTNEFRKASWLVDGLLGTGLKGAARGWTKEAIP